MSAAESERIAHAWIEAEGTIITGGRRVEDLHILIAS